MAHVAHLKNERFVARVTSEDKGLLERAATLEGYPSVAQFVITFARKAAERIIERHDTIHLDKNQSRRFVEALLSPPRPATERMKRAVQLHKKTVAKS